MTESIWGHGAVAPDACVTSPLPGEITVSYVVEVVEGAVTIEGPRGVP
jgi:hypothetical protein